MKSFRAIQSAYPTLGPWLDQIDLPTMPPITRTTIPEAVVKIVVGQMLSTTAANTIYGRLQDHSRKSNLEGTWLLSGNDMRLAGLSWRKVKTIQGFAQVYQNNPSRIHSWSDLTYDDLRMDVCKLWGLSSWSVDMLAIFHLGHLDVFPISDGTIKRAIQELQSIGAVDDTFDGSKAAPHRTFLALILWQLIDLNVFKNSRF